jgi:hypothetical protein
MAIKTVVMALMKLKIVEHEHVLKIGSVVIIRVNAYHLYGFVTVSPTLFSFLIISFN